MIKENIFKVKERISLACSRCNRNPSEITVVAVSKNRTTAQIKEAMEAGIADIGENKVQEALLKYKTIQQAVDDRQPNWHMVGHLQKNKAKTAVEIFDLIHSVDTIELAREIDRQAAKINKIQEILIEVKTSPEETKFGLSPDETIEAIKETHDLKNIKIKGLMTIAPLVDNPEEARPYFRMLRELLDKINKLSTTDYRLSTLSMGMTDDFKVAIEEGANIVRIGRAIFEG
jgi:hypothetical protein